MGKANPIQIKIQNILKFRTHNLIVSMYAIKSLHIVPSIHSFFGEREREKRGRKQVRRRLLKSFGIMICWWFWRMGVDPPFW